ARGDRDHEIEADPVGEAPHEGDHGDQQRECRDGAEDDGADARDDDRHDDIALSRSSTTWKTRTGLPRARRPDWIWSMQPGFALATASARVARTAATLDDW